MVFSPLTYYNNARGLRETVVDSALNIVCENLGRDLKVSFRPRRQKDYRLTRAEWNSCSRIALTKWSQCTAGLFRTNDLSNQKMKHWSVAAMSG